MTFIICNDGIYDASKLYLTQRNFSRHQSNSDYIIYKKIISADIDLVILSDLIISDPRVFNVLAYFNLY